MKKSFVFLLTVLTLTAAAQDQDPKAKAILDEVSRVSKAYKTITADVVFSALDKDKKPLDKPQTWKIMTKGQKFRVEIPGTSIVSDGKTLWNYNKDAKEVTIKNFDPENDEQNPAKLFTMYENGYKYKYDKEEKVGNVMCHVIDLYPSIKPERKKFHTVKLYVDKTKKQVVRMRMVMKDGGVQVYDIKSLKPNAEIADTQFVFDLKGFKADQINDERD
jgi:outer membrane lipoprotein carrier protein